MVAGDRTPELSDGAVGACGLFCGACAIYLASRDDPKRLALLAERLGQTIDEIQCTGCRSQKLAKYCATCKLVSCANERGHAFCSDCADFPCATLVAFGRERPHRAEIMEDLARIREIGRDAWVVEVVARYSCPECGAANSAYDLRCRVCGHTPGCAYSADHFQEIEAALARPLVDN